MKELEGKCYVRPDCSLCRNILRIGDFVDGHYPYEQEYNRCLKCKKKEAKKGKSNVSDR